MVAATYEESLRRLLAAEGGYTNHPSDPGGPTNFGITIADYRRYAKPGATAVDVRAMTIDEAKAIYRVHYWNAMRCGELPAGIDYCVFDYAVNSGMGRAAKVLQRALGCTVTGGVDDATLRLARAGDARKLIAAICDERLQFLHGLKTWPVFGAGWSRRVQTVRAAALAMAGHAAAVPVSSDTAASHGKAVVPVNTRAQRGTTAGIVAVGGAAAAFVGDATTIVIVLAFTIAAAAGAWAYWHWRQQQRQTAPATLPGQVIS